jgi:hypothetical protein
MKQRTRIYYTEADKALMWERWMDSRQPPLERLVRISPLLVYGSHGSELPTKIFLQRPSPARAQTAVTSCFCD